jgi:hypothetical protein
MAFAESETQLAYPVKILSYYRDVYVGETDLGIVAPGQRTLWHLLPRTQLGQWKEEIILNGTYSGTIRYNISQIGE